MNAQAPGLHKRWLRVHLRGSICLLALLAGCGSPPGQPAPSKLTITFTPAPFVAGDLVLTSARLRLDHIVAIGDAPPPMNGGLSPMQMLELDALGGAQSVRFDMLIPGLYSRVRLNFSQVMLTGSWRGHPLTVSLGRVMGPQVDLRSATGHELGHGEDATLSVTVDPNRWLDGNVLDGVPLSGGSVIVDDGSPQAQPILGHMTQSFSIE